MVTIWLFGCLVSYALGCINAAYYWIYWVHDEDLRNSGSGNAGARNAGRLYGAGSFLIVLFLDALLGAIAVMIGLALSGTDSLLPGLCGLMAVIGHSFPAQLGFRGGKGIAKAIGVLIVLFIAEATSSLLQVIPGMLLLLLFTHRSNILRHLGMAGKSS